MTQKSLVYMVLAVAVGYLLVSAIPQQVAMYTTPQQILLTGEGGATFEDSLPSEGDTVTVSPDGSNEDAVVAAEQAAEASETRSFEVTGSPFEPSFMELSQLPELAKWWTLDILIALAIYWVAKQRLA